MAFTIKGGKFSTDDRGNIRQPRVVVEDPVEEVIDILTAPSRPAPVNVGMMPERRGDVTIPMQPSESKRVQPGQQLAILRNLGLNSANYQMDPKDNLGFVQSPFITKRNPVGSVDDVLFNLSLADAAGQPINYGGGEGQLAPANVAYIPDLNTYDDVGNIMNPAAPLGRNEGIANIPNVANISSGYPMKPDPGYEAALQKATPSGLEGIIQGFLGSLTGSDPAIYMQTDEYGDPMGGGNYAVGRTFENAETAKRLGFIPVGRDAGGNIVYDVDPAIKASQDRQDRDARLDDERRERAAMLAAQQQQPIDPCPEGYRMDPVSRVCVPTDDTTEPVETTKRTYETMTEPVADYTAKTDFTVPTVTLPDILTYG